MHSHGISKLCLFNDLASLEFVIAVIICFYQIFDRNIRNVLLFSADRCIFVYILSR